MVGRLVMVVGAGGGGLGSAVCRRVIELGGRVIGLDTSAAALAELEAQAGPAERFVPIVADAGDRAAVRAAFAQAPGTVDGLVNVVGGTRARHWARLSEVGVQEWDDVLARNLGYVLPVCQEMVEPLAAVGSAGSIVNIASVAGLTSAPLHAGYGVAKAAMVHLTRTMAVEWGPAGVRVNAVAPGTVSVPRSVVPADLAGRERRIPLGRRGRASEVADAVAYLLSDAASYVTGQILAVDGGLSARSGYLDEDNAPLFLLNPDVRARLGLPAIPNR